MPGYEVRPPSDKHGVNLISDALPFGRLWYAEPNAISNVIGYAKFRSRSHHAVIRVYDAAGLPRPGACGRPFGGAGKTAAQKNTNTAPAPVHSQKPRCQSTECRSAPRIGAAQDGSRRVSSSRNSLQKSPASGTTVVKDEVQNRPRLQPFHAHHQPDNIPIAMDAAE
jgi:hypothetical protein